MTEAPPEPGYLDALFTAIRSFAREIAAARAWLARAREASDSPWRFQPLAATRDALDRARACLAEVEDRLVALGSPGEIPPPLDQLPGNVAAMRADLEVEEGRFAAIARGMAERPLGEG
jgi:hypothetical protein